MESLCAGSTPSRGRITERKKMKSFLLRTLIVLSLVGFAGIVHAEMVKYVVDFEEFSDALNADAALHGSNYGWSWNNTTDRMYSGVMPEGMHVHEYTNSSNYAVGHFTSNDVTFSHLYAQSDWGGMYYWEGTGVSAVKDTTYASFQNEMVSVTGSGAYGSETYGVVYSGGLYNNEAFLPYFTLPDNATLSGMMIANTVYALYSMTNGDEFAGAMIDGGFFTLFAHGYDIDGNYIDTISWNLGNDQEIPNDWRWWDMSELAGATKVEFDFDSHDKFGPWLNYPMYFAFDDLTYFIDDGNDPGAATPEPASMLVVGLGLGGLFIVRRRIRKK